MGARLLGEGSIRVRLPRLTTQCSRQAPSQKRNGAQTKSRKGSYKDLGLLELIVGGRMHLQYYRNDQYG